MRRKVTKLLKDFCRVLNEENPSFYRSLKKTWNHIPRNVRVEERGRILKLIKPSN